MSAAGEECSCRMNTDNYFGCAIANADSVSMDINDDDNQTVGCAIAHAAHADFCLIPILMILVMMTMTVVVW
jgi:hypothetical protein